MNFNVLLSNNIFNLEQLGPGESLDRCIIEMSSLIQKYSG